MSTIGALIERFYLNNSEMNAYKKLVEEDKTAIKQLMVDPKSKETKFVERSGDLVATVNVITKEYFDDDKLLKIVKNIWSTQNGSATCPWIKTIEVVDMEAIESAIYDKQINASDLNVAKIIKTEQRLTVRKEKNKNDGSN